MNNDINTAEIEIDADNMHHRDLNRNIKNMITENAGKLSCITVKNVLGQRYIGDGITGNITIKLYGTPGNDLAAFMDGPTIEVFGNGQDGIGNTMNSGRVIIHGDCGDITGYSMRGGEIYVKGNVGWRNGIHMKSYLEKYPALVIGGRAGNFLGEYMAGGLIIVLGLYKHKETVGDYTGTGMHGGTIFIRGEVEDYKLGKEVRKMPFEENDKEVLQRYTEGFCRHFGLDCTSFAKQDFSNFIKLAPYSHRPYGKLYAY